MLSQSPPEPPARRSSAGRYVFPLLLVAVGVILLLNNLGVIPWTIWIALGQLWPIVLILLGVELLLGRRSAWLGTAVAAVVIVAAFAIALGLTFTQSQSGASAALFQPQTANLPLAGATSGLMLTCIWGGQRYAWGSPVILLLIAMTLLLAGALIVRERRAADPVVPLELLRTRVVAVASTALFLATAALFAITVFVPLFLQTTTGASPTQAGLLMVPMMLGITLSTTVAGCAGWPGWSPWCSRIRMPRSTGSCA